MITSHERVIAAPAGRINLAANSRRNRSLNRLAIAASRVGAEQTHRSNFPA